MDSEPGRTLIVWTMRLAVGCWCVAVLTAIRTAPGRRAEPGTRWFWSAAWMLTCVHVVFAFHYEHHWSHAAALRHTAELTERVIGRSWGGGLFINYGFLAIWGADVFRVWWRSGATTSVCFLSITAFMMINATVVFGPRWWILPGVVMTVAVTRGLTARRRAVAGR